MQQDDESDVRDAMLFRFWCRAASSGSGLVYKTAKAIAPCVTPDDYRRALTALARENGVNIP